MSGSVIHLLASAAEEGRPPMRVGFLLLPDFALMSYASAVEPLRAANRLAGRELYAWRHVSLDGETATASNVMCRRRASGRSATSTARC